MKICLVLDDSLDRPDGVQQYVRTVGAYMTAAGHEVHYLCSGDMPADLANVHSLTTNAKTVANGNLLRTPLPAPPGAVRAFVEEHRFDVIHVQTPHHPLYSARVVDAARRLQGDGVSIVATFHILPDSKLISSGTWLLGKVLRGNLRKFDHFCATSAPTAVFAKRTFGIDSVVIPNAVDVAAFAAAAKGAKRAPGVVTVAYLGRLVPRKGVAELVDAVAALPAEARANLRVRVGGKGPMLEALRGRVRDRGLGEVVEFVGFVAEEDKARFYAEADVAVFPATGGESFGIVLIEAMASGSGAVLGGDNPGYSSVLGDDPAVTVDATDTAAFAAKLGALVTDRALRERVGHDQAQLVKSYDVNVVGARLEKFYREG